MTRREVPTRPTASYVGMLICPSACPRIHPSITAEAVELIQQKRFSLTWACHPCDQFRVACPRQTGRDNHDSARGANPSDYIIRGHAHRARQHAHVPIPRLRQRLAELLQPIRTSLTWACHPCDQFRVACPRQSGRDPYNAARGAIPSDCITRGHALCAGQHAHVPMPRSRQS